MPKYANKVVEQARAWLGKNEKDGSFKVIIDTYNAHKPLARGYTVRYTDEWCATFVSAVAIKLGYTDIMPTECSCGKMIELHKKLGQWVENDAYKPAPGDVIMYDWEDDGTGDNTGSPNHVGIVEKVEGSTITVIEGNKGGAVARRIVTINSKHIRGYAVPKYNKEDNTMAKDNKPDNYAKASVEKAVKKGVIVGDENGDLMLHDSVTRQDLMVFFDRLGLLD